MSINDRQNDTSIESVKPEPINAMEHIHELADRAPFSHLYSELCKRNLRDFSLGPEFLNLLVKLNAKHMNHNNSESFPVKFVSENALHASVDNSSIESLYYEDYIYQCKSVPTRANWHDFYNGLIWLQFPQTKGYFNALHQQQIMQFGRKQRTPVRDRLTHFDECGLILLTNQTELKNEIEAHDWQKVFVKRKAQWHKQIQPFIFGHALWEMLMQPFVGLTAKVTVIHIDDVYAASESNTLLSPNTGLDHLLLSQLQSQQTLEHRKPWLPLPLLGIPDWSHLPQNAAFYTNENYFMPKPLHRNKASL